MWLFKLYYCDYLLLFESYDTHSAHSLLALKTFILFCERKRQCEKVNIPWKIASLIVCEKNCNGCGGIGHYLRFIYRFTKYFFIILNGTSINYIQFLVFNQKNISFACNIM